MYKIIYDNRLGQVPMTMQGYLNRFEKELFLTVKNEYENTYGLSISTHLPEDIHLSTNKYYLNFSAYLVLDEQNNVVDFAFTEFNDLMWILNLINTNGIHFNVPDVVYKKGIEPTLEYYDNLIKIVQIENQNK